MFYQYFCKRNIKRHQPILIIVFGNSGKSMAANSIKTILKDTNKNVLLIEQNKNTAKLLARGSKNGSMLSVLLNYFFYKKYPQFIIHEGLPQSKLISEVNHFYLVLTGQEFSEKESFDEEKIEILLDSYPQEKSIIYNKSYESVGKLKSKILISYGIDEDEADLNGQYIENITNDDHFSIDKRIQGVRSKIAHKGSNLPLQIMGGIGVQQIYAALAAVAICHTLGVNLVDALNSLKEMAVLPGRMSLIPGIKKSLLVDDSYDTDYHSALLGLEQVSKIVLGENNKRIAVLSGIANDKHSNSALGNAVAQMGYHIVVGVGEGAFEILRSAESSGMDQMQLFHFDDVKQAGLFVQNKLRSDDLVYIKGAKNYRFENVVKELMAFPLQAKRDLIRR